MALVDYGSSSSDEDEDADEANLKLPKPNHDSQNGTSVSTSQRPSNTVSKLPAPFEKLPDASLLLNSPDFSFPQISGNEHSSRVAVARAENESRKRESKGSASSLPRSKYPRGNLPHSRAVRETGGDLLVPPQLNGRSNVVTEDIGKLFVRRAEPSSH
ncbi:hypothetical protein GIB67_019888 [Kingdonia uniflora]|uniref:Uncharacterized protein n=1 Tax=Kingdonia uniflora TaxID=39325 RepID=A0A7J7MKM0_9MAGN|nr:hypothetical protein GIB67_019888 [Kingdonia uniflora]